MSKASSSTFLSYRLFSSPSASLSYEVRDLQPHTEYAFRLVASNGFGSAHSAWIVFMTTEDSKWSEQYTAKCPLHCGILDVFSFSKQRNKPSLFSWHLVSGIFCKVRVDILQSWDILLLLSRKKENVALEG